ncbi:MAG: adenylate/guanylate cyclase domain-containing protein [Candidatus Pacearchaeota archaeon]|jgi:class 3 adenylate cyclase
MSKEDGLWLIKKVDFFVDFNSELSVACKKILRLAIKKTNAKGGAILIKDPLDKKLKEISKIKRKDNKLIRQCFHEGKFVFKNKKIAIPIKIRREVFGVVYLRGTDLKKHPDEILENLETILDGRFKYEYDSIGLRKTFRRYLGEEVMKKVLEDKSKDVLLGEKHNCTILFADLNKFTEFTNKVPAEKTVEFLNDVFGALIPIAIKMKGTVSDIIGDELMVVFGSPFEQKDHAARAIKTAKLMMKTAKPFFKKHLHEKGGLSIGIASGKVVSGNVGHNEFMSFTFIGKKVNLASRLTSLAGKNQILVDKTTIDNAKNFKKRFFGKKILKGFSKKINVYEIL